MPTITRTIPYSNRLNEKLTNDLGEVFQGCSAEGTSVHVHLLDGASQNAINRATAIMEAHDLLLIAHSNGDLHHLSTDGLGGTAFRWTLAGLEGTAVMQAAGTALIDAVLLPGSYTVEIEDRAYPYGSGHLVFEV